MYQAKIKVCGITTVEDALIAIENGADALGFVFYPPSPRFITFEDAQNIIQKLPPFVTVCGLLVNPSSTDIQSAISCGINLIQFHGDESSEFCQKANFPYIKALRVKNTFSVNLFSSYQAAGARAILLDTLTSNAYGGTGQRFNWSIIPDEIRSQIILAGGLTVENIQQAIITTQPYAVDVSSGVESEKGIKSHSAIQSFCHAVRLANATINKHK